MNNTLKNMVTLQNNIANLDLSQLSGVTQDQIFELMKQIVSTVFSDFFTNPTMTSEQVTSVFQAMKAGQEANITKTISPSI